MSYKQKLDDAVDYPFKHKALEIGAEADKELEAKEKLIIELENCPRTIWGAANKVSCVYFECEDDANRYAGSFGATVNINVFPVDVITKKGKED